MKRGTVAKAAFFALFGAISLCPIFANEGEWRFGVSMSMTTPFETELFDPGFAISASLSRGIVGPIALSVEGEYARNGVVGSKNTPILFPGAYLGVEFEARLPGSFVAGIKPRLGVAQTSFGDNYAIVLGAGVDGRLERRVSPTLSAFATGGYLVYTNDDFDQTLMTALKFGLGLARYF